MYAVTALFSSDDYPDYVSHEINFNVSVHDSATSIGSTCEVASLPDFGGMPGTHNQKIGNAGVNIGSLTGIPDCSNTFFYTLVIFDSMYNELDPQPTFVSFVEETLSFDVVALESHIAYAGSIYIVELSISKKRFWLSFHKRPR